MSAVNVIWYLLKSDAALIAVVPAARIISGVLPETTALPAIAVTQVSAVRRHPVAGTATEFVTARVQVTVMANTYPSQKSIMALVRAALPRTRGTVDSIAVDSILSDSEGPDFENVDIGARMGSIDYIVTFTN